jgi:DNA repair photolyase
MLGELYKPKGLALETAQAVLEVENPYACNVALGCSNACLYCYVPKATRRRRYDCIQVRLPAKAPVELIKHQLRRFDLTSKLGVFLSFLTDPFLPQIKKSTEQLIAFLLDQGVTIATLSKLATSYYHSQHGMTVVSLNRDFWRKFEPNTLEPQRRIAALQDCKGDKEYCWVSMEPYPPSAIYKQNLEALLEELNFVDLIVFGKWNYDPRARTEEARRDYAENVQVLTDFCKSNNIRLHVKSETLKFIGLMLG